jgi:transcriptional regulator with XRE-family HTH domain
MDQIADWVAEGRSTRQIAEIAGCSQITLMRWLRSDMIRSARFDEALLIAAEHFEDRAISYLDSAADEIRAEPELANPIVTLARERAQAAWRQASVRDPRRYSDRRTSSDVSVTIKHDVSALPTSELERIVAQHKGTLELESDGQVTDPGG